MLFDGEGAPRGSRRFYAPDKFTPEQVRQTVRALIQDVGVNGGYCVGSGNSVPQYVRPENYQAMLNAVREFGRY